MINTILSILLASSFTLGAIEPDATTTTSPTPTTETTSPESAAAYTTPRQLLDALALQDATITSMSGAVRYTVINALQNDRQMRYGKLAIRNTIADDQSVDARKYAVSFTILELEDRQEKIDEQYIFDGRWFVERLPQEKQFNKRELVPAGQTLDPMELMRDAPFWVSLGRDQDRLLGSYDAELLPTNNGLIDDPNFPELKNFTELPHVAGTYQLKLTPKPGSGFEDDWEWVRIWINPTTLLPSLYIKSEWTGDLQIVELFSTKSNTKIPDEVFDTTTPDERSGWRVQISKWRGND